MTELDLAELSAFLDGELDPARAAVVEALIAADPGIRAELRRLKLADERLRTRAQAAAFRPEIRWPEAAPRRTEAWPAAGVCLIVAAWIVGKLATAISAALLLNAASLLLVIAVLAPLALREARAGEPSIA